jgi:hypothetical protein
MSLYYRNTTDRLKRDVVTEWVINVIDSLRTFLLTDFILSSIQQLLLLLLSATIELVSFFLEFSRAHIYIIRNSRVFLQGLKCSIVVGDNLMAYHPTDFRQNFFRSFRRPLTSTVGLEH